jgi:hypothetical protein
MPEAQGMSTEFEDVETSPESVDLLNEIQQMIIDHNPRRDQALCICAELMVWALLCASPDGKVATEQAETMFPAILENIAANAEGMMARKKILEELQQEGAPKWVN